MNISNCKTGNVNSKFMDEVELFALCLLLVIFARCASLFARRLLVFTRCMLLLRPRYAMKYKLFYKHYFFSIHPQFCLIFA